MKLDNVQRKEVFEKTNFYTAFMQYAMIKLKEITFCPDSLTLTCTIPCS
jgi:hypothetical protein